MSTLITDIPDTLGKEFADEPGCKYIFELVGWSVYDAQPSFSSFGNFNSTSDAIAWLKAIGFQPHPERDHVLGTMRGCWLYEAGENREQLIINGQLFAKVEVRIQKHAPLPVLFNNLPG